MTYANTTIIRHFDLSIKNTVLYKEVMLKGNMQRLFTHIPFLLLALLFSSCVYNDEIYGVKGGSAKVIYHRGQESLTSVKKHSVDIIPPPPDNFTVDYPELPFFVLVRNKSNQTFDFNPKNIVAKWESKKSKDAVKKDVYVYNFSEMVKKIQRRKNAAVFLAILGGAAGAYNAAQASTYRTYGYVGNTSFSSTTYNSGLANALAIQNATQTTNNLNKARKTARRETNTVQNVILGRQTMAPNSQYGGELYLKNPFFDNFSGISRGGKIYITIPVGKEQHSFVFQVDTALENRKKTHSKN